MKTIQWVGIALMIVPLLGYHIARVVPGRMGKDEDASIHALALIAFALTGIGLIASGCD